MANDNRRRPPHGHDPEQARREAAKAREARRKHSGSASRNSRSHSTGTRKNDISKKSRYYQVRRQKMFLAAGGILIILVLVIIFSARACISSRKAAEAAALQKAQEEEAAKKAKEEAAAVKDPVSLTLSVVGDCTLGTDETFDYDTSLNACYDNNGKDYFFKNVKSIFEADDLTIANFEGTLTDSDAREDKTFAFKAPAEYAQILTSGSVEAVNTANNHSHDYGEQSYTDTLTALDNAGITHFGYDDTAVMDIKGIKVGLVGIYELKDHLGREQQLKDNIAKVKADGAELIVVIFHWGNETETVPDTNQMTLGRLAIDEGADLVCGHHPHVLQGIETYKGKNIVYSLGNFCFGGNSSPSDMDTMIFQQTFTVTSEGVQADNVTNIIPVLFPLLMDITTISQLLLPVMRLPVSRRRSRNEAQQFRQLILLLLPVQQEVPTVPTAILLTAQIAALPAVQMFRTEQITQMIIPIMEMILISPTTVKNSPIKIL